MGFADTISRDLDRINVQYPLYAAKTLAEGKKVFNFVFVSSMSTIVHISQKAKLCR